jgi:hypothetical protein
MTPDQKGSIAEAAIVCAAVKLGVGVSRPVSPQRYDLVFDLGPLVRVQCKWAVHIDDVVTFRSYSCRRGPSGLIKRAYTADEIDAFAAYCAELERCYFLPVKDFPQQRAIQLRLAPTHNNQRVGINWAQDFEFDRLNWSDLGP